MDRDLFVCFICGQLRSQVRTEVNQPHSLKEGWRGDGDREGGVDGNVGIQGYQEHDELFYQKIESSSKKREYVTAVLLLSVCCC